MDYFLARYYSSAQGRFTSPDEFSGGPVELYEFADSASDNPTFYADLHEPQSLNKYHYALGNPLRYLDPDGHQAVAQALREGGQMLQSTGNPYIAAAGRVLIGAGAAYIALKDVDLKEVADAMGSSGAKTGMLAGTGQSLVTAGPTKPTSVTFPNGHESLEPDGIDPTGRIHRKGQTEPQQANVPKPPKGKGSVPPDQRDPKRVWTSKENQRKLDQGPALPSDIIFRRREKEKGSRNRRFLSRTSSNRAASRGSDLSLLTFCAF